MTSDSLRTTASWRCARAFPGRLRSDSRRSLVSGVWPSDEPRAPGRWTTIAPARAPRVAAPLDEISTYLLRPRAQPVCACFEGASARHGTGLATARLLEQVGRAK